MSCPIRVGLEMQRISMECLHARQKKNSYKQKTKNHCPNRDTTIDVP